MTTGCNLAVGGVSVQKDLITEGVPHAAIRYAFSTEGSDSITVQLIESLPAEVAFEDIGFHEAFDGTRWRPVDGDRLLYEGVVEPEEQLVTCFFVRNGEAELADFDRPPAVKIDRSDPERSYPVQAATWGEKWTGEVDSGAPGEPFGSIDWSDVTSLDRDPSGEDGDATLQLNDPFPDSTEHDRDQGDDSDVALPEPSPDVPLRLNQPRSGLDRR